MKPNSIIYFLFACIVLSCSTIKKTDDSKLGNTFHCADTVMLSWRKPILLNLSSEEIIDEINIIASKLRKGDTIGDNIKIFNRFERLVIDSQTLVYYFRYKDFYQIPYDSIHLKKHINNLTIRKKTILDHYSNYLFKYLLEVDYPVPLEEKDYNRLKCGNGKIIQNYFPIYEKASNSWNYNVQYACLSVSNSRLNGTSYFFYPNGDTLAYGNYFNNMKNGVWYFREYESRNGRTDTIEYNIEFKHDDVEGLYTVTKNNILIFKFRLYDMKPVGNCEMFYDSGNLKAKFYLNHIQPNIGKCKNIVGIGDLLPEDISAKNFFVCEYGIERSADHRYSFTKTAYDINNRFDGFLFSLYENGDSRKPKSHFKFKNGRIQFGTVNFENGNIYKEWDAESLTKTVYNEDGSVLYTDSLSADCFWIGL